MLAFSSTTSKMSGIVFGRDTVRLCNGVIMPLIGCSTYQVAGADNVDSLVDRALRIGYRLFDTAADYNNEAHLGKALNKYLPKYHLRREDVFVTTKVEPTDYAAARETALNSLRRLRTDHVDLLLVHCPPQPFDAAEPSIGAQLRQETWNALGNIKSGGGARAIGVSNFDVAQLEALVGGPPHVNQSQCHPHYTREQLRQYCVQNNIHFQAVRPLAGGDPALLEEPVLQAIAATHQTTVPQVLLAWAVQQGVSVLLRSSAIERLRSNYGAARLRLSLPQLDAISALNRHTTDQTDQQSRA